MPKRDDIKTILLIGSGPIVIGQACEFDYSGTQAAKTLKELGYKVVLINSNPATIMTDPEFADRTYIEPITEEIVADIIKKEKVDAILPTMGGQTALNIAMSMYEKGMLKGVQFLGAKPEAIKKGEDRQAFKEAMLKIGMDLPKSCYAYTLQEALEAAKEIGFPLIIRASFTLAGGGSGVAYNIDEFKALAQNGLEVSPINEILIEESLLGWKEFEMEVIRDKSDNCIIVCSIENLDPMGVHTGDSITIAPALTLTDKEYQRMRDASFKILREIGVDTGGSNVQFAINPQNGRMTVIEMNPRVSRSSALASKATGYPIAKVATLLAVGYTLDEIKNDITGTPASFEPSIDYIVTKIPRFTFEKFPQADSTLTTSMKSIGEVMAIGATFKESLQKALNSLETGVFGFNPISSDLSEIQREIRRPNASRLLYIAEAFRNGVSVAEVQEWSKIDAYFLHQIAEIIAFEKNISFEMLQIESFLREAKQNGFSDKMLAFLANKKEGLELREEDIYALRQRLQVNLQYNEVDTCAAEFATQTAYLYSTTPFFPINPTPTSSDKKKVLIIGGGPNRIGQGIEFDYCCVHASFALRDMGITSIMYNCNPETVSTDYDTSDTLYFEPITFECVRSVIEREKPDGIIVHFGGQTPLKLAKKLTTIGANIIGTSAKTIDIAEDREKFAKFVEENGLLQPKNGTAYTKEEAIGIAQNIGFPVLVRPSYVLGGRAMRIVYNVAELQNYMSEAVSVSEDSPVLIDKFLNNALELDVDIICDGRDVYIAGIMQHIEEAGIHSGDSACSIPTISISKEKIKEIEETTAKIARNLGVIGLMNTQYAIFEDTLYLIEVNPRASRTVPFVSKATGIPLAKVATDVMVNRDLKAALERYDRFKKVEFKDGLYKPKASKHIAVKESVFPFSKLNGAVMVLGPEMRSTGEVMGISESFGVSFAKSQLACKNPIPTSGKVFISLRSLDKPQAEILAKELKEMGFELCATKGTAKAINEAGVECQEALKISEGRPNIGDMLANGEIALAINTSDEASSKDDTDKIRTQVLRNSVPYFTTIEAARVAISAINEIKKVNPNTAKALQDYLG
ncbi:carbamoyl-phosphate synthase large subunit [Helicobacter pullorum]|uniref:carbamoyl-phosphate synthase large subunit n=1 Tax=Helicobacter pullorum TaxID=35818 RepID=UPI0006BA6EA9|nr:carbamoyl-phosphate synthase large subunit [Helicobacter pullorum]KAB0574045.1 carbamoyl-phosphate synthase large subunit [Helicobacter pullorum NCTC 12824]KPH52572.1 carbamoyl phosphate synthase large subunit [Helicobacter pullorum]OCR06013.1 carbamoyl phosphate synthase large subunit [Helicobacter pullorum]OCR09528.1 carbamoyl phosphate synthase large subunit [Helicobacter pullorum]OCR17278.1 carbamoyl phosphate synthase large subunit [Helicobacter pullorum]